MYTDIHLGFGRDVRHRIVTDVARGSLKRIRAQNANLREPLLPEWRLRCKFLPRAKGKPAFHELNGTFDRHPAFDGEQKMKMIGHDHEFMEPKFVLGAIVVEHF